MRVVASFSLLADMARVVGGDVVAVESLVGPDADAHAWEPTPTDARRLAQAELVLVNGLGFESWMDRLLKVSGSAAPVVVATRGITPRQQEGGAESHQEGHRHESRREGADDPHAWQDLRNAIHYVRNIETALIEARPLQAEGIRKRGAAYRAEMQALDRSIRESLAVIPVARRKIVTSHDAFGYFGAAYGVIFMAPLGMDADAEPSASAFAALVRQVRREGVRELFIENWGNPRLIQQLAEEAGATIGGRLYADALSGPEGAAPSFLALFRQNAALMLGSMRGKDAPK